jgi:plasmid stabilization system protein ParE
MALRYKILPEAKEELQQSMAWYHDRNPEVAERLLSCYRQKVRNICEHPEKYACVRFC